MGGCFRFFVGLFCAMLALEVLAELFSWTDVPFDALLLLAAGVKAVYGEVMSEEAHRLLSDAGLCVKYGTLVPEILNRAGTAPCPMEQAAAAVTDPAEALPVLRKAMQELQKQ